MTKPGTKFEIWVKELIQSITDCENKYGLKTIQIQRNYYLEDRNGLKRQFDVYWQFELCGFKYTKVIECKDYDSKISLEKIDALKGKLADFNDIGGIIATTKGYQEGVLKKAEATGIELLLVRNEDEKLDCKASDGTPLIREFDIRLTLTPKIIIKKLEFNFDNDWLKKNIEVEECIEASLDTIRICDDEAKKTFKIEELVGDQGKINATEETITTDFIQNFNDNTFLEIQGLRAKILGIKIIYEIPPTITHEIKYKPKVVGVIEYLINKQKKIVLTDGDSKFVKTLL